MKAFMRKQRSILQSILFGLLTLVAGLIPARATVTRYRSGNPEDATPTLHGPAYNLGGGAKDVMEAIQWMVDQVRGADPAAKLDVVVLRATGADGYNKGILALNGVNSVETLVITSPADARTPEVETTIRNAEVIFFAGGDQCDYVTNFKGTQVEAAVKAVVAKGGAVGGTSAGCAIMGSIVFDACRNKRKGNVTSVQALANPYDPEISFTSGFFAWPDLEGILTDTHFVPRDRMGRTLAFLARQIKDGVVSRALGVAVNERTSLVIDKAGLGHVMGEGPVYVVLAEHPPELCLPGQPLTYLGFKFWRLGPGQTFDFSHRPTSGFYRRSVIKGVLSADPYDGLPEPGTQSPSGSRVGTP
jgi:cyanophycinase